MGTHGSIQVAMQAELSGEDDFEVYFGVLVEMDGMEMPKLACDLLKELASRSKHGVDVGEIIAGLVNCCGTNTRARLMSGEEFQIPEEAWYDVVIRRKYVEDADGDGEHCWQVWQPRREDIDGEEADSVDGWAPARVLVSVPACCCEIGAY